MSRVTGRAVDLSLLKRVMTYVRPYRRKFITTVFTTLLLAALSPLRPWLIQYTFDNYISSPNPAMLLVFTLVATGVLFIEAIVQFSNTYAANWLGQKVIRNLRSDLFRKITNFRLRYFDYTPIGTLVTRVISDLETIADIFSEGLLVIIGDLLKVVVIIAAMFIADVELALISLSTLPVLFFSTWIFKNAIKATFQDVRNQVARLNAFVQEHLTGMFIVQIFNREEKEMASFKEINAAHRNAHIRSVWHYSIFLPVVELLSSISIAFLIWWGAPQILDDDITLGSLIAFILYIHMLFRPIRELADKFNTLQMGMVSSERVFKIIDTAEEIEDRGVVPADAIQGRISFKDVWFSYNQDEWVLKGVSYVAEPGETIAIVGATGAGKSSVISLLSRFYEYQKGEIKIDDKNIREYKLESLRHNIALVLQDVFLFSDTIHNNITLGNENISREAVIRAAKAVGAHDFIQRLPDGYDFNVQERGGMLSVGQRQLISFIRAYVYNPKILILDEATSSVDMESEELIQRAISTLTENRTSIVVAHRLATIKKADKILVMEQGKVVESGTHQQLLLQNGHYKRLYEIQFQDSPLVE